MSGEAKIRESESGCLKRPSLSVVTGLVVAPNARAQASHAEHVPLRMVAVAITEAFPQARRLQREKGEHLLISGNTEANNAGIFKNTTRARG